MADSHAEREQATAIQSGMGSVEVMHNISFLQFAIAALFVALFVAIAEKVDAKAGAGLAILTIASVMAFNADKLTGFANWAQSIFNPTASGGAASAGTQRRG